VRHTVYEIRKTDESGCNTNNRPVQSRDQDLGV